MAATDRSPVTGRLVRRGREEILAEREFWASMSGEERVECLWEMVLEVRRIKELEGDEPRLQRSAGCLLDA